MQLAGSKGTGQWNCASTSFSFSCSWSFCRVVLETSGNVQILNPTKKEMGTYHCMVENDFGSDVGISALFYAGTIQFWHFAYHRQSHFLLWFHVLLPQGALSCTEASFFFKKAVSGLASRKGATQVGRKPLVGLSCFLGNTSEHHCFDFALISGKKTLRLSCNALVITRLPIGNRQDPR